MPTANMCQVAINFTMPNGDNASVIRHLEFGAPITANDILIPGPVVEDWWDVDAGPVTAAKTAFVSALTLTDVTTTQLTGGPPLQAVWSVGITGTQPGDAPPNESSVVSTWYTGFPGRSFRGRSFWPGYAPTNLSSNGTLDDAATVVYQDKFDRLNDALNAIAGDSAANHCVYSRLLDVMTPITSVVARDVLHHQSRRNG